MSRILLVEDNPLNAKLSHLVLTSGGYELEWERTGTAALERLRQELFDLVVLDIRMPDMDGLEIARRLRADPRTHALRILVHSAHAMQGQQEAILAAGCDAYIPKPTSRVELLSAVAALLQA